MLAAACPGCGRPNVVPAPPVDGFVVRVLKMLFMAGGSIVVLLIVIAVLVSHGKSGDGATPTESPVTSSVAAPPEPPLEVSAGTLFQDYDDNEVSADARYKGRALLVSGRVHSIDKNFTNDVIVRLQTSNQFQSVMATMADSEAGAAAQLHKRQPVKLLCKGGTRIIGSPTLDHCSIASSGP